MKTLLMALVLLSVSKVSAESQQFGLGVILGSPTGISANYLLSSKNSIDAGLGFGDDDVHVHVDYLWRFPKSLQANDISFGWYGGVGAKFRDHDHDDRNNNGNNHEHHDDGEFGPRVVGGLNYDFDQLPIEIFAEASMILYIIDETDVDVDFGIGGRYYF